MYVQLQQCINISLVELVVDVEKILTQIISAANGS